MNFTKVTAAISSTLARWGMTFTRQIMRDATPDIALIAQQEAPHLALQETDSHDAEIDALRRCFDKVMLKLDRIEAKIDMLVNVPAPS